MGSLRADGGTTSWSKWAEVALDEVTLSQKSSEDDFLEAEALRSITPSRNSCVDFELNLPLDDCGAASTSATDHAGRSSVYTQEPNAVLFCDPVEHGPPVLWWAKLLRQHSANLGCDATIRPPRPLKVLSGCSGMLSEAMVLQAGPGMTARLGTCGASAAEFALAVSVSLSYMHFWFVLDS